MQKFRGESAVPLHSQENLESGGTRRGEHGAIE
jgi:hypothetical protein